MTMRFPKNLERSRDLKDEFRMRSCLLSVHIRTPTNVSGVLSGEHIFKGRARWKSAIKAPWKDVGERPVRRDEKAAVYRAAAYSYHRAESQN